MINRLNLNNFLGNPKPRKLQKSSVFVIFHTKSETHRSNVCELFLTVKTAYFCAIGCCMR